MICWEISQGLNRSGILNGGYISLSLSFALSLSLPLSLSLSEVLSKAPAWICPQILPEFPWSEASAMANRQSARFILFG